MAKNIASLNDLKAAPGAPAVEKPKKSKDELKAERVKHLKPKVKDPQKAAEDKQIQDHIKALLTKTPAGMLVKDLRVNIFNETDESKYPALEKRIRFLARDMGCLRLSVQDSRQKLYKLP